MQHLEEALEQFSDEIHKYVTLDNNKITFTIQDGPIKEVGKNGIQITDMLNYCKEVYISLNHSFPCAENDLTIQNIDCALYAQMIRTTNRELRGVEGFNKA